MSQEIDLNSFTGTLVLWCPEHETHFVEGDECGHEQCDNMLSCHGYIGGRQVSCGGIEKRCLLRAAR